MSKSKEDTVINPNVDDVTIGKLRSDMRDAAGLMSKGEARFAVDLYYQIQEFRKATANQVRSMKAEPTAILGWSFDSMAMIETEIKLALDEYTKSEPSGMGMWARNILGIGPVISAGLLAYIDLEPWKCMSTDREDRCTERAMTESNEERAKRKARVDRDKHFLMGCGRKRIRAVGSVWRYAGLDPTSVWNEGQRRPWNAALKVLCWKIGQSFVKVSNNPGSQYGALYKQRKVYEVKRNEAGELQPQAMASLASKKFKRDTFAKRAYDQGLLPAARLDLRATRWTVKIFLYHWTAEAYLRRFGEKLSEPYVISHLDHVDFIEAREGGNEEED